jgi:hypothetical protein
MKPTRRNALLAGLALAAGPATVGFSDSADAGLFAKIAAHRVAAAEFEAAWLSAPDDDDRHARLSNEADEAFYAIVEDLTPPVSHHGQLALIDHMLCFPENWNDWGDIGDELRVVLRAALNCGGRLSHR